jgi:pyruvate,orthophosphate dikinase
VAKKPVKKAVKVAKKPAKSTPAKKASAKKAPAKKATAKVTKPSAKSGKYVYFFGDGKADGDSKMKNLLGGKGANLAEMVNLDIPVPSGFTITTEVCTYYYANGKKYPQELTAQVEAALTRVEKLNAKKFGDPQNPLLVSVRSGARASMPGMMDTILNLGLNDTTVKGLVARSGNERFAYDSYRRFVQMYGDVVLDLKPKTKDDIDPFEEILHAKKEARGVKFDTDLTAADLKELVAEFKAAIKRETGRDFPEDPKAQLWGAIGAVFSSWMNERAIAYRNLNKIPEEWGTAVNVQSMVFGNMGEDSGTGVAFTRDAATGANVFYGEFLMNAQGEDVVAGTRTPLPIIQLKDRDPKAYKELMKIRAVLERHYRDMMDIEFTIEHGKLYMLQCRVGKRTAFSAIKIAVDMVAEKLITPAEALLRVEPDQLNQLLRPIFDAAEKQKAVKAGHLLAKGLNAGPGAATGRIAFNAEDAVAMGAKKDPVILVRIETSPEDIKGMNAAEGILTARGGSSSHAALVARQMGKVCVAGCGALDIDYKKREMRIEGRDDLVIKEGDFISIDGSSGEVLLGNIPTKPSEVLQVLLYNTLKPQDSPVYQEYAKLMAWADKARRMKIRANADQPDQASNALAFGAEGIGLCRTEHMFFGGDRITFVREMILADDRAGRDRALAKLLPIQRADFKGILKAMEGLPVTIRLLDPPLHEFLPQTEKDYQAVAASSGLAVDKLKAKSHTLHESNPMLGHRGCRLAVTWPEIYEMQVRAIIEAACELKKEGVKVVPEIMHPLVGYEAELKMLRELTVRIADQVQKEKGIKVAYTIGTMIELPRAAVTADEIARQADFFSFGTNDLTQTTLGMSRDDAGTFLADYTEQKIIPGDPFASIDRTGVGKVVKMGVDLGRSTKPDLKVGVCGEHGGDPDSIDLFEKIGLSYVSCSPFRVPIARLAAAHAALKNAPKK